MLAVIVVFSPTHLEVIYRNIGAHVYILTFYYFFSYNIKYIWYFILLKVLNPRNSHYSSLEDY